MPSQALPNRISGYPLKLGAVCRSRTYYFLLTRQAHRQQCLHSRICISNLQLTACISRQYSLGKPLRHIHKAHQSEHH